MTGKESQRLGAFLTNPERAMISQQHRNILAKIYKSEMQKLMYLHGCDIDRGMLDIVNSGYRSLSLINYNGCSDKMVLLSSPGQGENARIVAAYSFRMVEAYDDWKKNSLSLVKTLEKKNQFAKYERGGNEADGCTFLSFIKSIKAFCMLNNLYDVETDRRAWVRPSNGEVEPHFTIPPYSRPEYEPYDCGDYLEMW